MKDIEKLNKAVFYQESANKTHIFSKMRDEITAFKA